MNPGGFVLFRPAGKDITLPTAGHQGVMSSAFEQSLQPVVFTWKREESLFPAIFLEFGLCDI